MSVLSIRHSHPYYAGEKCLNHVQRKHPCSVCTTVCPHGAFSLDPKQPINWERCTDCGLCVAACPSRCFAPSAERQKRLAEDLNLNEAVSFSCRREEELCSVREKCLTAIPWELIAATALYTDAVLYVGACRTCRDGKSRKGVEALLETLRSFLGEELLASRIHVLEEGSFHRPDPPAEEKSLSRRAVFAGVGVRLKKEALRAAARRMPFLENTEENGMQYRMLLAGAVREEVQRNPSFRAGVLLPQFTAACTACGICEKICPQKAISFGEKQENGRTVWLTPWRCTACELCVKTCPREGIAGMHVVRVPRMTEVPLVRIP